MQNRCSCIAHDRKHWGQDWLEPDSEILTWQAHDSHRAFPSRCRGGENAEGGKVIAAVGYKCKSHPPFFLNEIVKQGRAERERERQEIAEKKESLGFRQILASL